MRMYCQEALSYDTCIMHEFRIIIQTIPSVNELHKKAKPGVSLCKLIKTRRKTETYILYKYKL